MPRGELLLRGLRDRLRLLSLRLRHHHRLFHRRRCRHLRLLGLYRLRLLRLGLCRLRLPRHSLPGSLLALKVAVFGLGSWLDRNRLWVAVGLAGFGHLSAFCWDIDDWDLFVEGVCGVARCQKNLYS